MGAPMTLEHCSGHNFSLYPGHHWVNVRLTSACDVSTLTVAVEAFDALEAPAIGAVGVGGVYIGIERRTVGRKWVETPRTLWLEDFGAGFAYAGHDVQLELINRYEASRVRASVMVRWFEPAAPVAPEPSPARASFVEELRMLARKRSKSARRLKSTPELIEASHERADVTHEAARVLAREWGLP
jgi:hypothetical protein